MLTLYGEITESFTIFCSAMTGENVEEAFDLLIKNALHITSMREGGRDGGREGRREGTWEKPNAVVTY